MEKKQLFLMEFFQGFQKKESFYEKILEEKNVVRYILNHFLIMILFSFIYGIVMGSYNGFLQALSSGIKVPILISLVILICFPAFYVIQSVLGSKLTLIQMLSVILSGFVLISSIMVSFAPIVIFFLLTGGNYSFMKLLHVGIFALSGLFGMRTIIETLKFSCEKKNVYPKIGVQVFKFWIIILAFVGAQLSWSLRPFIGSKDQPFQLIRHQEGNIYKALIMTIEDLIKSQAEKTDIKNNTEKLKEVPQQSTEDEEKR